MNKTEVKKLRKKILLIGITILTALLVYFVLWYGAKAYHAGISYWKNSVAKEDVGMILFFQPDCDHCVKVDDFIRKNNLADKLHITWLEISHNSINESIMADKAQICGIDYKTIGVPFLWDGSHCIIGDYDIINFLKTKL